MTRQSAHAVLAAALLCLAVVAAGTARGQSSCPTVNFSQQTTYPPGLNVQDVCSGDFNGDGALDLAVSAFANDQVMILTGDGSGGFAKSFVRKGTGSVHEILAADIDRDGKLDLVMGAIWARLVGIARGNGDGSFQPPSVLSVASGHQLSWILVRDLNNDGWPDIAATDGLNTLVVFLATGNGAFGAPSSYDAGTSAVRDLEAGYFNGDAYLDIVVSSADGGGSQGWPGKIAVFMNDGTGRYGAATRYDGHTPDNCHVAVADMNHDGRDDILVSNSHYASVAVRLNDGSGGFATRTDYPVGGYCRSIVPCDLNGDGWTDVVTSTEFGAGQKLVVLPGVSGGGLGAAVNYDANERPYMIDVADYNRDGRPDVALSDQEAEQVWLRFGDGAGGLGPVSVIDFYANSGATAPIVRDANGDGIRDAVTVNRVSRTCSFYAGTGGGGFAPPVRKELCTTGSYSTLAVPVAADFTGDGIPDVATSHDSRDSLLVVPMTASGGFGDPLRYACPGLPTVVVAQDFNRDGYADLAAACASAGVVRLFAGTAAGLSASSTSLAVAGNPNTMIATDLNNDGAADLVVLQVPASSPGNSSIGIFLGQGNGSFTATATLAFASAPWSIALTSLDYNNDGNRDLALYCEQTGGLLYPGLGNGQFGPSSPFGAATLTYNTVELLAMDINGDGIEDVLAAPSLQAYVADGCTLVDAGTFPSSGFPWIAAAGDLNADGRPDVVGANAQSADLTTMLNTTTACQSVATGSLPASVCPAQAVSVPFTTAGFYYCDNRYTAQLSDASGSFENAVAIGSGTASPIAAVIPPGTPAGTGYRIRVVASHPAVLGNDNGSNIRISGMQGTYAIPGDYPSVAAAIADLNASCITGPVTFNVAAGYTEQFASATAGRITATGSASAPIVFRKDGQGANPLVTAAAGTGSYDGVIVIAGGDDISFDGIDVADNASNTTTAARMEWGYALLKRAASAPVDGCQRVTIARCAVTLARAHSSSAGIAVLNSTPTGGTPSSCPMATDRHNDCTIADNVVGGCNMGIRLYGPSASAQYDEGNAVSGNTIADIGTPGSSAFGVYGYGQEALTVSGNTVAATGLAVSSLYGVYCGSGGARSVTGNTVSASGTVSSSCFGISLTGGLPGKEALLSGNTVESIAVQGASSSATGIEISVSSGSGTVAGNAVRHILAEGTSSTVRGITSAAYAPVRLVNNTVSGLSAPLSLSLSAVTGVLLSSGAVEFDHNTVYLDAATSTPQSGSSGVHASGVPALTMRNNIVVNLSVAAGGGTAAAFRNGGARTVCQPASGNNCWHAGAPGAARLLYLDAAGGIQDIDALRAYMNADLSGREASSFSELPPFANTAAMPYDLHLSASAPTRCESGGAAIPAPGVGEDRDGETRHGYAGYAGLGSAPDVGSDEGAFAPVVCSGMPDAGFAVMGPRRVCATTVGAFTLRGHWNDAGLSYQWEESDDRGVSDPWSPAAGSGAATPLFVSPPYANPIWYRCRVTCAASGQSAYSEPVAFRAIAGSYTIDPSLLPSNANFTSFGEVVRALATAGVCGAAQFHVAQGAGPFTEHLSIPPIDGASETDTVSFHGRGAELRWAPAADDHSIVDLNGADHVRIDGLRITGTSPSRGIGILLRNDARDNVIRDCDIDLTAAGRQSNTAGIAATASATSLGSSGNNAANCSIIGNRIVGGEDGGPAYGISLYGSLDARAPGLVVERNSITDAWGYGIALQYLENAVVRGNAISRPRCSATGAFTGISASSMNGMTAEANRVFSPFGGNPAAGGGFYGIQHSGIASSIPTLIANNVLSCEAGSGTLMGIYSSGASGAVIAHNTVSLCGAVPGASGVSAYGISVQNPGSSGAVRNNIVRITRPGGAYKICLVYQGGSPAVSDNNVLHVAGQGQNHVGQYFSTRFATLVSWRTAGGGQFDGASVDDDPAFADPADGDLVPQSPAVNSRGADLTALVPFDIAGAQRPSAWPDPGAYEFVPAPMAIASVAAAGVAAAPVLPGTAGLAMLHVTVTAAGGLSPLQLTEAAFSTAGSTSAADIAEARLYATGGSPVFSAASQVGVAAASPSGTYSFSGSVALVPGGNHFWLVYDIAAAALNCDQVHATLATVTAGGQAHAPGGPAGAARTVRTPLAGSYSISHLQAPSCTAYSTIRDALVDATAVGVAGHVIFEVAAGHMETSSNIVLRTATAGLDRSITLRKSGTGANPLITAAPGAGTLDGVLTVAGTDYVTIDGIDIAEPATVAGTAARMEWGYGVMNVSAADGAQHIAIRNCVLHLAPGSASSRGIHQAHVTPESPLELGVTSPDGIASDNRYDGNSIDGAWTAISAAGYSSNWDMRISIGASAGNNVAGFIGAGISLTNATEAVLTGNTAVTDRLAPGGSGIFAERMSGVLCGNDVSVSSTATAPSGGGIICRSYTTGNLPITVCDNVVHDCSFPNAATSFELYGMSVNIYSYPVVIRNNTVRDFTVSASAAESQGTIYGMMLGVGQSGATVPSEVTGNAVERVTRSGNAQSNSVMYGISIAGTISTAIVTNTTVQSVSNGSSASELIPLQIGTSTGTIWNVSGSTVRDATNYGTVRGMLCRSAPNGVFAYNSISGLAASSPTAQVFGLQLVPSNGTGIYNTMISDLRNPNSGVVPAIAGIYYFGTSTSTTTYSIYNSIHLDAAGTQPGFSTAGIWAPTSPALDLRNTIVANESEAGASGIAAALWLGTGFPGNYAAASDANCLHAGDAGPRNLIYSNGTGGDQTLADYKARMAALAPPRDQRSVTELPPFANVAAAPYDLHLDGLTSSVCDGAGLSVTAPVAVTDDFDRQPRGATAADPPDIGADEINHAPVALAADVTVAAAAGCTAQASVDNGSHDTDGDAITLAQQPAGPYPVGVTAVTLTVTDEHGASSTAAAVVTVTESGAPALVLSQTPITFWSPNHDYVTVALPQMVASVTDDCDPAPAVAITRVTSDEPENHPGGGDGNTYNDILIANDCRSADLRSERMATGDGRVYTITIRARDASGNAVERQFLVTVPLSQSSGPAVAGAVQYEVRSACSPPKAAAPEAPAEPLLALEGASPNPFSQRAAIRYSASADAVITLRVHDLAGREVARLVDGPVAAGEHVAVFDAAGLPAGTYIVRLTGAGRSLARRVTLLR